MRRFDQKEVTKTLWVKHNIEDYYLMTVKPWFVGFFDLGSNVGATSGLMELTLDSGYRGDGN